MGAVSTAIKASW